jgi:tripartite-type tricarboxylate transporter receptor subunit TctC
MKECFSKVSIALVGRRMLERVGMVTQGLLLCLVTTSIQSQEYPSRPIRMVVPSTSGITSDTLARLLGPRLSKKWGVAVVVDNKAGAGGIIGAEAVANAEPDGYTLLVANTSFGTLAAINPKLPYDPIKSFASVSLLSTSVMTLVVPEKMSASTVREFVEMVKKQPGQLNYSSPGVGTTQHLAMELIKQRTGINLLHVPYKGSAGALSDLIAGHVQASVVAMQTAAPYVESKRIKMIAILGTQKSTQFSNVPLMSAAGYGDMVVETWSAVMAPAGTPAAIIAKLNLEIDAQLLMPEVREAMTKQGVVPVGGRPERLDQWLRSEISLWSEVVARGKISAN